MTFEEQIKAIEKAGFRLFFLGEQRLVDDQLSVWVCDLVKRTKNDIWGYKPRFYCGMAHSASAAIEKALRLAAEGKGWDRHADKADAWNREADSVAADAAWRMLGEAIDDLNDAIYAITDIPF